ncbi:hypothetical protein V5F63_00710 [Xanthobacter autotrophicus DSM 597]|uniref:hypothetical protein n=1 Tax=Xanthobacter TaxID=279 RepID=UPI001AEAB356|nr:hypothetical protein [Xanthobacter flavus]MBP2148525.1 hypothetical protein [Xanthobacter flavus]
MRVAICSWLPVATLAAGLLLPVDGARAQSACPVASGQLVPGQLYLRSPDGRRWIDATGPEVKSVMATSDRVRAIYALEPDRGGVVAIKLRNEAPRTERDTADVQEVHIERPALNESCFAGRRGPMDRRVAAREYDDYHAAGLKESQLLHAFHFRYRSTERPDCHRTDDANIGGRRHYSFTQPGESGEPTFRVAEISGDAIPLILVPVRDAIAVITGLKPAQAQAGGAPGMRYVYLRTMLRRYQPVPQGAPNCVAFSFDAAANVTTTYVTVADLDTGQQSTVPQRTWTLRWARPER